MSRAFRLPDGSLDAAALLEWQMSGKVPPGCDELPEGWCPRCRGTRHVHGETCDACDFPGPVGRKVRLEEWEGWLEAGWLEAERQRLEASMMAPGLIVRSRLEAREIRWVIGGSGGGGGRDDAAAPAAQPRSPAATWPMQVHEGIAAAGLWLCETIEGIFD